MKKFLADWVTHYLKHKDVFTERIEKISETEKGLLVHNKDGSEKIVLIEPFLNEFKPKLAGLEGKDIAIVVFNSRENFNAMLNDWNDIAKFEKLTIIFVNPFSMMDTKWVLSPYFHNRIADPVSLKSGLKSIFSSVEEITKEQAEKKIK